MRSSLLLFAFWVLPGLLFAEVEWEPDVYPQSNLFPSLIIGTARVDLSEELFASWDGEHLGDEQGLIGIRLSGAKKGQKVQVTVRANDFMEESEFSGVLKEDAKSLMIHPKISYKYDALAKVDQTVPLDLTIAVKLDDQDLGKKTVTTTLRSINDCLFGVEEEHEDGDTETSDYSWLFSAYVNENHPWVDKILKEALETRLVNSFDGYQSEEPESVLMQVFAIWNVMQRRGFRYSDITTTGAQSEGVYSQHVRLFDQSLEASQANCVDGTVLFAALLRKIGLHPCLVIVPGHMFLAFYVDDDTLLGLETTMLGEKDLPALDKKTKARLKNLEEYKNQESWESFEAALAVGTQAIDENWKKFESDSLDFQIIDLGEAREAGILPILSVKKD